MAFACKANEETHQGFESLRHHMKLKNDIPLYNYLIKIYGISHAKAIKLSVYIGANPKTNFKNLSSQKRDSLIKALSFYRKSKDQQAIGDNLIKYQKSQLQRKIINNSLPGKRFKLRLPIRGQRTKSNARNAKTQRYARIA